MKVKLVPPQCLLILSSIVILFLLTSFINCDRDEGEEYVDTYFTSTAFTTPSTSTAKPTTNHKSDSGITTLSLEPPKDKQKDNKEKTKPEEDYANDDGTDEEDDSEEDTKQDIKNESKKDKSSNTDDDDEEEVKVKDSSDEEDEDVEDDEDSESDSNEEEQEAPLIERIITKLTIDYPEKPNQTALEKWLEGNKRFGDIISMVMKDTLPLILEQMQSVDVSPSCGNSMTKLMSGLQNNKLWVFRMLDSNGHFPSGTMSGTLSSLGDFEQCLSIKDPDGEEDDPHAIVGKYCLLKMRPALPPKPDRLEFDTLLVNLTNTPMEGSWIEKALVPQLYNFYYYHLVNGICVPSSCNEQDLEQVMGGFLKQFHMNVSVGACRTHQSPFISSGRTLPVFPIFFISLFIFLVIIGSIIDWLVGTFSDHDHDPSLPIQIFKCFSICQNTTKLFALPQQYLTNKTDENDNKYSSSGSDCSTANQLNFVHGMRVLSIIWVVIGHSYLNGFLLIHPDFPFANLFTRSREEALLITKAFLTQWIINGSFAVETFFFISGFILAYIMLPLVKCKKMTFSLHGFMLLRWIRFTPLLVGTISLHLLWPYFGSGPFMHPDYVSLLTRPCYQYWWQNLIYISNWLPAQDQCMIHTWYLSADFQLHFISFFVLGIMSLSLKTGVVMTWIMMLLGAVIPAIVAAVNNLPPMPLFTADKHRQIRDLDLMQFRTYNHMTPYFMGLFIGYLIVERKTFNNRFLSPIIWLTTFSMSLIALFITYIWSNLEYKYSTLTASFYFGIHRFLWISGIAWMCFCCSNGRAKLINTILSSHVFIVLSRLTFSIYLTHMLVYWFYLFTAGNVLEASNFNLFFNASAVFFMSIFVAYFAHVIFEAPINNLVKLLTRKSNKSSSNISSMRKKNLERVFAGKNVLSHRNSIESEKHTKL